MGPEEKRGRGRAEESRRANVLTALVTAGLLIAVFSIAACGDDAIVGEDGGGGGEASQSEVSELEHIHGLGVGPRDGTLYIATHSGLFTVGSGETKVERVGESRQDIMGFSVAEPGRFLGSGHPDPADASQPPNLGLIESTDGGRSWERVSLLGEADFHVLESDGDRVYGFDGTQSRLMVSDDGGRNWEQRTPPAPVFDLAIGPTDRDRVVAATEVGLFISDNAGDDWQPRSRELAGLLAWPSDDALYLVDSTGVAHASEDAGESFQPVGSVGGQPAAFMAHEDSLYAALHDGTVKASADGGASWVLRAAP